MDVKIAESWKPYLATEFDKGYFFDLSQFVKNEYARATCYPEGKKIFAAFDHCSFEALKVVIIGQDPYHGPKQANGLCFSVNPNIVIPPSLDNIFKEIKNDLGIQYPSNGDLTRWADQGVLLLNATLTVRAGEAGSHQKKGWEIFTDAVIKSISDNKENVVFLLWGGYARGKVKLIDLKKHFILESGHPSPLSANRGLWFGNSHFSKTNQFLTEKGKSPIVW